MTRRVFRTLNFPVAELPFCADFWQETPFPPLTISAVASPVTQAETPTPTVMSDKNPKAKRKQQSQQQMHKQHKSEEQQRHQQQLLESHLMKHPHEMKG